MSHYEEVTSAMREHMGEKVRLTAPNGGTTTGIVGEYVYAPGESEITLDGRGGLSTFHDAALLEVKDGQRYRQVAAWPERREAWLNDWERLTGRTHPSRRIVVSILGETEKSGESAAAAAEVFIDAETKAENEAADYIAEYYPAAPSSWDEMDAAQPLYGGYN